MNSMDSLQKGQNICVVCEHEQNENAENPRFAKELTGFSDITYNNVKDILDAKDICRFHAVLVDYGVELTEELINKIHALTKPDGFICIRYVVTAECNPEFLLKTNGYINVTTKTEPTKEVIAFKPKYEIGSAVKLRLMPTPAVWKLDDLADQEVETIDPDNLLDADDFKKPDESSLRVCGTTGKRKACRDCTCGLAEELDAERAAKNPVDSAEAKSSCGSCYLGDAFRCATCPYLGLPAFKPGEKVQLTDNILKADV